MTTTTAQQITIKVNGPVMVAESGDTWYSPCPVCPFGLRIGYAAGGVGMITLQACEHAVPHRPVGEVFFCHSPYFAPHFVIPAPAPAIPTTRANVPSDEQADAFYASIQARAAAIKVERAAKPARKPRVTKAEKQLALMVAQYERDVAANPNTIIYNPKTTLWDAYRDGECVAQAATYLAAEAARLAHLTRDAEGVVAVEEPCATCQGKTVTGQYLATDPCPSCGERLCIYCDCRCQQAALLPPVGGDGDDQIPPPPALSADEAADVDALAAHVARELAATGAEALSDDDGADMDARMVAAVTDLNVPAVFPTADLERIMLCPLCLDAVYQARILHHLAEVHAEVIVGMVPDSYRQAPKPLPTCEVPGCGRTAISHRVRWCGCIIGENEPPTWDCQCDGCGQWGDCVCSLVTAEEAAWLRQQARAQATELPPFVLSSLAAAVEANDRADPLPFTPTPAENLAALDEATAFLLEIEEMAGVVDDEMVRRLAA